MDQTLGQEPDNLEELSPVADPAPDGQGITAPDESQQTVFVKYCLFCHSTIPAEALACSHCGKQVAIFEGKVYKQLYWMFYAGLAVFIGSLLPLGVFTEGVGYSTVAGYATVPGAIALLFSIMLMVGMVFGIWAKRFLMSPILLMFVPAIWSWWRVVEAVVRLEAALVNLEAAAKAGGASVAVEPGWYQLFFKLDYHALLWDKLGTGMLFMWAGSSIVVLVFLLNFMGAIFGGGDKAKGGERAQARTKSPAKKRDKSRGREKHGRSGSGRRERNRR